MAAVKGVVAPADYIFNKTAKTITFSANYTGLALSDIMYITNVVSGVATVIYDPQNAAKGGSLTGLVLTLAYDTSAMNNADTLQIIIGMGTLENYAKETGGNLATLVTALNTLNATINSSNQQKTSVDDLSILIKRAIQALERPTYTTPTGMVKVDVQTAGSGSAQGANIPVAMTSTGNNISTFGTAAQDQSFVAFSANRAAFNDYKNRIIS